MLGTELYRTATYSRTDFVLFLVMKQGIVIQYHSGTPGKMDLGPYWLQFAM